MDGLPHAVQAKDELAQEPSPIDASSFVWLRKARIFAGAEPVRQMRRAFRAVLSVQPMPGQGHRRAARVKRQKIWHPGAEAAKRPLPFGRASRWKQTMSGKIVPRE